MPTGPASLGRAESPLERRLTWLTGLRLLVLTIFFGSHLDLHSSLSSKSMRGDNQRERE